MSINKEIIRNNFPHIKDGRIYFNHASIGPLSIPVRERINQYLDYRSTNPLKAFELFMVSDKTAKSRLAKLLNCPEDQISWSENVSTALSLLANGLTWNPGDRVILNDIEFPANVYPFLNLKSKGVEIDIVKSKDGIINIEDIEKSITRETKLISISLVQFLSGYRSDIVSLGKICKERNILFSVDAIQGAGVVEIDIDKGNIDFLAGGGHKWLMSLVGTGYFYISKNLMQKIEQQNVGWVSVKDTWNLLDYNLDLRDNADRYQTGTMNSIGVVALESSLSMFESVGISEIETEILSNTNYFIEKLEEIGITPILANIKDIHKAGTVTFKIENAEKVLSDLKEKNIIGEIREGMIRMSPHFYNTKDEIDEVIAQLKK